jgi:hypothetical protein
MAVGPMATSRNNDESQFPRVVAWFGLALAVVLFLSNTVPAVRERQQLRATATDLQRLRQQYDAAIAHATAAMPGPAGEQDLQSVLVAIDRIGWTPAELLRCYPEATPAPAAVDAEEPPTLEPDTGDSAAPATGR